MTVARVMVSERQYWEHLRPVYAALEPTERGGVQSWNGFIKPDDLPPAGGAEPTHWLTSSYRDAYRARHTVRLPTIYLEHGVGLAGVSGSATGVAAFLVPNQYLAAQYAKKRPGTPAIVVGTAKMDELAAIPKPDNYRPVVAVSVHWSSNARFLRPWYDAVHALAKDFHVLAHAHPRAQKQGYLMGIKGLEIVPDFTDVVRRADVYVCDYSSTIYEWAALDRPGVVIEHQLQRPTEMFHAWPIGEHCTLAGLGYAVRAALENHSLTQAGERARIREELYPYWGHAAARTVEAIRTGV